MGGQVGQIVAGYARNTDQKARFVVTRVSRELDLISEIDDSQVLTNLSRAQDFRVVTGSAAVFDHREIQGREGDFSVKVDEQLLKDEGKLEFILTGKTTGETKRADGAVFGYQYMRAWVSSYAGLRCEDRCRTRDNGCGASCPIIRPEGG